MDELTLLRKVRDDVEEPTSDALDAGSNALQQWMVSHPSARKTRTHRARRVAGWTVLGTVAAIGIVVALVATNILGLAGWRGGASAAAADTLGDAALAAVNNSDPTVGPGQYLRVATDAVDSVTTDGSRPGSFVGYLTEETSQVYVPANLRDNWVWFQEAAKPYKTFGAESAAAAAKNYRNILSGPEHGVEKLRAPGGRFYSAPPTVSPAALATLPRDPYQLLNYIYRVNGTSGSSPDQEALVYIADTLRSGLVPAGLRAAMYRAAAMIPGVSVIASEATLDGRTGVAIGRTEPSDHLRQEIIIDPSTGLLIGERMVTLVAQSGLPAGTALEWTAVTTSVVDSAPAGGTQNGAFDVEGCTKIPHGFHCPQG
ncbi:MAG TPA: CU044_5270 family protein [Galbitalea sp.]|jgi:RNA polymerase sigma-70 factor (ECF subfamily)|nr:CU044_5270 family protein [Galbitalea sp.]